MFKWIKKNNTTNSDDTTTKTSKLEKYKAYIDPNKKMSTTCPRCHKDLQPQHKLIFVIAISKTKKIEDMFVTPTKKSQLCLSCNVVMISNGELGKALIARMDDPNDYWSLIGLYHWDNFTTEQQQKWDRDWENKYFDDLDTYPHAKIVSQTHLNSIDNNAVATKLSQSKNKGKRKQKAKAQQKARKRNRK